jgi:hypothetical protein
LNCYRAYGLTFRSVLPLPELAEHAGSPDVVIRLGKLSQVTDAEREKNRHIDPRPEGIYLAWRNVGAFFVRGGREIVVDPHPGVEPRLLRLYTLGTTLALLLHQRQRLTVLHASVADIGGSAVAFVGAKRAGKSTLAAALHFRGHELIADDILAVDLNHATPLALPGFPQIKLWPDSAESLGIHPEALPRLRAELDKRGPRVQHGFATSPVPLERIYVLTPGAEIGIEPLSSHEAVRSLLQHWYGARFGSDLVGALGLSTHLLHSAALARAVRVHRLSRPDSLERVGEIVDLVERDLSGVALLEAV